MVMLYIPINPILTGGGGVNLTPPLHEIRDWVATAADRDASFYDFFFQVLRIFWYQVCENRTIGRKVTRLFVLARRLKICPKSAILHMFVYKNTWKLLIFLKCSKTVFILSFWPCAQFLISSN